jgi:xylulokinase
MKELYIGLDLGTTGCKSAVYDDGLVCRGEAYLEYPLLHPTLGFVEQSAETWWDLSLEAVRRSLVDVPNRSLVRAIAVSSQGLSIVPTDRGGLPLGPAISWLDNRGQSELERIAECYTEEELFARTGKSLGGAYVLPKLLWLQHHRPKLYERTHRFLMPLDYLTGRLCGRAVTDPTMASGTMLYDIISRCWDEGIAGRLGIDTGKLAELGCSGEVVGTLLPSVADVLGLLPSTRVVLGGQDQKCASLAAGIDGSTTTVSLGTASAIEKLFHRPLLDPLRQIPTFAYLFDGQWVCEGCVMTAGGAMRWFRDNWASGTPYPELDQMARSGSGIEDRTYFYPFLSGAATEVSEARKRSAVGVLYGLDLDTDSAKAARAVMEGIGFQIDGQVQRIGQSFGDSQRIRLFGGGAKSRFWCQMMADITGLPIEVPGTIETAAMGAAMLAAMGTAGDLMRIVGQQTLQARFEPDPELHGRYAEKKNRYFQIQDHLLAMPE